MLNIDLDKHKQCLLNPALSERDLKSLVTSISQKFTAKRDEIGEYVSQKDMASAYAYFYLPTNLPKWDFLMEKIPLQLRGKLADVQFIDWGTGPGTYLLGYLNWYGKGDVTGVDTSEIMLEQAKKCLQAYFPESIPKLKKHISAPSPDKDTWLHFGNSLNEMSFDEFSAILKKLRPKYLSFIEPGTPAVFEQVLKIRESLSKQNYYSVYPCPGDITKACPMGAKRSEGIQEWCHQVLRITHDPSIERFSQLVKLDRKAMPMSAHFYCLNQNYNDQESIGTIVRFLRESKFSFDYQVCSHTGKVNELITIEILKKFMSKSEQKEFKKLSVGQRVSYEVQKQVSENHLKVKIKRPSE